MKIELKNYEKVEISKDIYKLLKEDLQYPSASMREILKSIISRAFVSEFTFPEPHPKTPLREYIDSKIQELIGRKNNTEFFDDKYEEWKKEKEKEKCEKWAEIQINEMKTETDEPKEMNNTKLTSFLISDEQAKKLNDFVSKTTFSKSDVIRIAINKLLEEQKNE